MCQRDKSCNVCIGGEKRISFSGICRQPITIYRIRMLLGSLCHKWSSRQDLANGDLTVMYTALCLTVRGQSRWCEVRQVFAGLWAVGCLQFLFSFCVTAKMSCPICRVPYH
jgi:hypothetical protein